MKCLKIAAGFVNQTPLDWDGNLENIKAAIRGAVDSGRVGLLCLPELCCTGYGCEDAFLSREVQERAFTMLFDICRFLKERGTEMVVCVGLPIMYRNALYNTVAVLRGNRILGLVPKQHLANDGLHYEARWFKPWPAGLTDVIHGDIPIGDILFSFAGIRVGFEICEDAWVAQRPGGILAANGVDIILNPSASHFAFGKHDVRTRFVTEGSRAFNCTYVYANLCGNEAGRAIYDGECMIATGGDVVAMGTRLSMKRFGLVMAIIDVDATRTLQAGTASFTPAHTMKEIGAYQMTEADQVVSSSISLPVVTDSTLARFDEMEHALTLALYDYMLKSGTRGFAISLSGGADSAACAVLVRLMIEKSVAELGHLEVVRQLHLGDVTEQSSIEALTNMLLTCFYQGTANSSLTTLTAAKKVAAEMGAKFLNIDVDHIVEAYKAEVSEALNCTLDWSTHDLPLQNIQARVRAPSAWLIANLENKLLLTTSNRSEAAVGYCTMDGDTAGSIAPIGGVDKTFLLEWLRFLANGQYPSLWYIVEQKPTAELRPGETQTDEADLMPYPILQAIETCAIQQKKGPKETYDTLAIKSDFPAQLLFSYVRKFYTLWCRNQWKRERYALSFHVDSRNLDPRSWCRFPVLNGGYVKELEELRVSLGAR